MILLNQTQELVPCPRGAEHPTEAADQMPTAEVGKEKAHGEPGWPAGAHGKSLRTYNKVKHWFEYYTICTKQQQTRLPLLTSESSPQR